MNRGARFAAPLLAFGLALLAPPPARAQSFQLPNFGDASKSENKTSSAGLGGLLGQVSGLAGNQGTQEEIQSGDAIAATVLGAAPVWRNPKVQNYVNLVGRNLARQVERKDVPWRFAVLDTPSVNAMAFPGGIVVITRGLYALLSSEDELAAVLAHEIAHVNRRHQWKVIQQQKLVALAGNTALGDNPEKTASLVADLGTRLIARGLDKSAEFEADRDGVVIATRAGYDSSAMISVLEKLAALKPGDPDTALLFSTHPAPEDRIAALAEAATPDLEAAAVPSPAAARIRGMQ